MPGNRLPGMSDGFNGLAKIQKSPTRSHNYLIHKLSLQELPKAAKGVCHPTPFAAFGLGIPRSACRNVPGAYLAVILKMPWALLLSKLRSRSPVSGSILRWINSTNEPGT